MSKNNAKVYDITVVGAGPVGLFATFYAGMRQMDIALVDSLAEVGGQLAALYPEKYIYDMPGFPKVIAKDLVRDLWEQAKFAKPDLYLNEKVAEVVAVTGAGNAGNEDSPDHYELRFESGRTLLSKTIVLALGMGAFEPQRLKVASLLPFEGKQVHYVVKSLKPFTGKDVLVVGGGDSAADWTQTLAEKRMGQTIAKNVTLIHRTDRFRCHEATLENLKTFDNVTVKPFFEIDSVEQTDGDRLLVTVRHSKDKTTENMVVDDIIICIGYVSKIDFVEKLGLNLKGKSILVDDTMQTSRPGIFAAGDGCSHTGKIKLIATGVGEAAIAANFAKTYIDPNARAFPGHSTSTMASKVK